MEKINSSTRLTSGYIRVYIRCMVTEFYNLKFNTAPSTVLHIDINSAFATIEQQYNPSLRYKPVAVVTREGPSGCILAASIEAKRLGVKGGMRMFEVKHICPQLITLTPSPDLYRKVHKQLKNLLLDYTAKVIPKSIDEFVLHMENYPYIKKHSMFDLADEIKFRINAEIGEYITTSIGIAPNRFLAKTGAGLIKPNGLNEINQYNHKEIFSKMKLKDLCGISRGNSAMLERVGIMNVTDFYNASFFKLRSAFQSIAAYYWYLKLRGWEIDDFETHRGSFSHSYMLNKPISTEMEIGRLLQKLVEKVAFKMRQEGYKARGVFVNIKYEKLNTPIDNLNLKSRSHWGKQHLYWGDAHTGMKEIFDSIDLYHAAKQILDARPLKMPIRQIVIGTFFVTKNEGLQLEFFDDVLKKDNYMKSIDSINEKFGKFTVKPAQMLATENLAPDAIAFGR